MLIRQGMPLRQVADLLGTSHESIHRLTKREGMDLRPGVQRLTATQRQEALASAVLKAVTQLSHLDISNRLYRLGPSGLGENCKDLVTVSSHYG